MKSTGALATGPRQIALALCLACVMTGCDSGRAPDQPEERALQLSEEELRRLSLRTREAWYLAEPVLHEAETGARNLHQAIEALLKTPSNETLGAAQEQWRQLATDYSPLDIYGILAQLAPEASAELQRLSFAIAAHPIEPGYLDSVGPYRYSGLVHDLGLPLAETSLRKQHGLTQNEDAALGLYAIEFMLFGEADERPRQAQEYEARQQLTAAEREHGYTEPEELPENRRRKLLQAQSQLLLEDLQRLAALWRAQTPESLYLAFVRLPPEQRFILLLRSAQVLVAEILGELEPTGEGHVPQSPPQEALAKQAAYLADMARAMQLDEELGRNLEQAAQVMEGAATEDESVRERAREHLENASLLLAGELARFAPQSD